jgi:endonuclease I
MPSLYLEKTSQLSFEKCSIEHIFPKSMIYKNDHNDMHNTIRTMSTLNVNRSNYKFTDYVNYNDKNWVKLDFDNYVNHKLQKFVPNEESRGFIARAILYMSKEYGYNTHNLINKDVLLEWFYMYPPLECERYHNSVVRRLQNKNNIYVSNYRNICKHLVKRHYI